MALIKCKYCGHPVSDKAVKCPKCGGDLTHRYSADNDEASDKDETKYAELPDSGNDDDDSPEHGNNNGLKILLWFIVCIIVVGASGYFVYWKQQKAELEAKIEAARQDSITAARMEAEREAARLDSIRQDSLKRVNFTSPDLTFFELHGDVKSCNTHWEGQSLEEPDLCEYNIKFNKDGIWINGWYQQNVYTKFYHTNVHRDTKGHIAKLLSPEEGMIDFIWHNNHVTSSVYKGYIAGAYCEPNVEISLKYSDENLLTSINQSWRSHGECLSNYKFGKYVFDQRGNWISRVRSGITQCEDRNETQYTEFREITYYSN